MGQAQSQTIRLDGSTGSAPLVRALASAFQAKRTGLEFAFGPGMGTSKRIASLKAGEIDIAMASHGLDVVRLRADGWIVIEIARTPVVFAIRKDVPLASITSGQVCAIYEGTAKDWQSIGAAAGPIKAFARPDSEVDMEVVRAGLPCMKTLKIAGTIEFAPRAQDMAKALTSNVGSIGMTTSTVVSQSAGELLTLALDGRKPDAANVNSGAYPLVRQAYLITKAQQGGIISEFLEFIRSPDGSKIIEGNGAFAVK
jgi:phosphate transport system substrate-binding protein